MPALIKICGISDKTGLDAALNAGVDMIGFVFFPHSPRNVSIATATALSRRVDRRAKCVALTVDSDDMMLDAIVSTLKPDILQLHGSETPARVSAVRSRYSVAVMRALSIGSQAGVGEIAAFDAVADFLLFDAPAPRMGRSPGGNGETFDWSLLRDVSTRSPWLLAGGLDASNVAEALIATGAAGVDVSSGVETMPGVKDPARIEAFVTAARAATTGATAALRTQEATR